MKQRLLSVAVASLLAGFSTQALADGPTFYGDLNVSITDSDTGVLLQGTEAKSGTVLENNSSNIGIKGTHDINQSLYVVYKAEVGVNGGEQSNGKDPFSSRNTYVGLGGGFGEVVFGRNDTAFKGSEAGVDAFGNLNADIFSILPGQDRVGDSITYTLPKLGLFTGKATYLLEDDFYAADAVNEGNNFAVMGGFGDKGLKKAPYYIGFGYVDGISDLTSYRITGQLKLADLQLGAIFQDSEKTSNSDVTAKGYILSAKYPLGNFMLKGQFGYDDGGMGAFGSKIETDGTVKEVTNYTVGVDYTLTKSAYVYGHVAYYDASIDNAEDIDDTLITVGMRYRF
ncbi:porin [Marinobacter hydrocarbonoclasticus]|nr:porin [Marinobacter nauticus]